MPHESDDTNPDKASARSSNAAELGQELQAVAAQRERTRSLVADKLMTAWGVTLDRFGVGNVHDTADLLYHALYDQSELAVEPDSRFPDRVELLEAPLESPPVREPERTEFIEAIRHTFNTKMDYADSLYEDAPDQLKNLMRLGFVRIWTEGDHDEDASHDGELAPGSRQQLYKVAQAVGPYRRQVAQETDPPRRLQDVLDASISTNKKALLNDVFSDLSDRGIQDVAILEDRAANIIAAVEAAEQHGLHPVPIWVRQGRQRGKVAEGQSLEQVIAAFNAVDSIGQVDQKLAELGYPKPGQNLATLVDFDGVLMDDAKRIASMKQSVVSDLEARGWI